MRPFLLRYLTMRYIHLLNKSLRGGKKKKGMGNSNTVLFFQFIEHFPIINLTSTYDKITAKNI